MQRINNIFGKKRLFIIFALVILGIVAIGTSYSIFTKTDKLTNIDFIAGNLSYEITSNDLIDNKITVNSNTETEFILTLTSSNSIDSKYEVYYLVDGIKQEIEGLTISYLTDGKDMPTGTIDSNEIKDITINIVNDTESSYEIEFGCVGGLVSNDLVMNKGNSIGEYVYTGELATEYIMNLAKTNTSELRIDTHEATGQQDFDVTEYRYWGASPNNYVEFNDEMWRIIGVFDVDDGTGKVEKRVKLIRNESIGNLAWDTSTENSGNGINEWSQADLKILLNEGDYYNSLNTYSTTGLTSDAKSMIGNAKWYLGAPVTDEITTDLMYKNERSSDNSKQCTQGTAYCNDNVERKTNWVGSVGLMYTSDYGYATDMNACQNVILYNYSNSCVLTDWLIADSNQWLLAPYGNTLYAGSVLHLISSGRVNGKLAYNALSVRPVVYLSSDVKIVDGTGESGANAFKLSK